MTKQKQPPITPQEAWVKYFGNVKELQNKPYPFPCSCGNFSAFTTSDSWIDHVKTAHDERVFSEKQIAAFERRAKEKEASNTGVDRIAAIIGGRSSN